MRALVTGGAGFVGSHLVDELVRLGYEVGVVDDLSGGFVENINSKAKFWPGVSVTDYFAVRAVFMEFKPDYVYHLAAYAAEGLSHFIRRHNYETNLVGSMNVINCCVNYKVKCLVFTSSIAVYGSNQTPMSESLEPKPEDPYGISKYAVELDLEAAHRMFGLNYIVFRPHNVYGPRQNIGDKYRNVIGIFMNNMMQGKQSVVFGDGEQTRAFTYVGDIVPVIAESVRDERLYGEVFNIGSDKPYTINDVISCLGVSDVRYDPERHEVKHAFADHSKIRSLYSLYETPLERGLGIMWRWAQRHGARETKKFKKIEIEEGLPESWR